MYRWDPEQYSRHSRQQEKWARELILKLALKGDERVLDIGCGDGKVSAEIACSLPGGRVLGIDSSPEMIEHAKRSFMDRCDNLAFLCLDAAEMSFGPEFDIVFSNAALHWVPDHLPLLKRIRRALRPSGRIMLQMAGEGNAAAMTDVVETVMRQDPWRPFFHGFSFPYAFHNDKDYRSLVEMAGLVVRRVEPHPQDHVARRKRGSGGLDPHDVASLHPESARRDEGGVYRGDSRRVCDEIRRRSGRILCRRDGEA